MTVEDTNRETSQLEKTVCRHELLALVGLSLRWVDSLGDSSGVGFSGFPGS